MATQTNHYQLAKPAEDDYYDVGVQNGNMEKIDQALNDLEESKASLGEDGKVKPDQLPEMDYEPPLADAEAKATLADNDGLVITDSAAENGTKRVLWSTVKSLLGGIFVPQTRKVNNKALSTDISLTASDVGAAAAGHTHPATQVTGLTANRALISNSSGQPAVSAVTSTELGYLDGVTSAIQTQLNGKAASSHNHSAANITSGTLGAARGGTGKASWAINRLIYPSAATTLAQLAFPKVAGSVLRQGTSGAPYWTSMADLATALASSGMAKIATGSYVGTGTYGASSPCSLTFPFPPKMVVIYCEDYALGHRAGSEANLHTTPWGQSFQIFLAGASTFPVKDNSGETYTRNTTYSISGENLSWYSENNGYGYRFQLNTSGQKYYWIAFG